MKHSYYYEPCKDFHEIISGKINICCYHVDHSCSYAPFLKYLLEYNHDSLSYKFPSIEVNSTENINQVVYDYLKITIDQSIVFKGYLTINNEYHVFFELFEYEKKDISSYGNALFQKCLIYEIVNLQKYYDIVISQNIVDLFVQNPNLCYLYKMPYNKHLYEIPVVAYNFVPNHMHKYVSFFEIILDNSYNYFKLFLHFKSTENRIENMFRHAVFIQNFYHINESKQGLTIQTYLETYNSIIDSTQNVIYIKSRKQQSKIK